MSDQGSSKDATTQAKLIARYKYRNHAGKVVYEVRRYAPKTFAQFRPVKGGAWIKGLGSAPRLPYNLPNIIKASNAGSRVYLVEGEKDADTLAARGYTASCTRGGPSVFLKDWVEYFGGVSDVVILCDDDKAGLRNAQRAYDLLREAGVAVRVFKCTKGKDVTEHLENGGKLSGRGQFKDVTAAVRALRDAGANGTSNGTVTGERSAQADVCAQWALDKLWRDPGDAVHNGRAAVAYKFAEQLRDVERSVAVEAMRIFWMACPQVNSEGELEEYPWVACSDTLESALGNVPLDWKPGVFANGALDEEQWDDLLMSLDDVTETTIKWLWKWRFPYGKVSILEGDPDLGKSLITLDLAARVTRGLSMPDQSVNQERVKRDVLLITLEDDPEDTIAPRLRAAGADSAHVHTMLLRKDDMGNSIPLTFPEDMPRLRHAIRKFNCALVIIDPIMGYLSETINSHNDASVRRAMTPFQQVAAETGVCVLMVRHLNKSGDMKKSKYRGAGSIAFTGAARSVFVVERHPSEPATVVMAKVKMNLAPSRVASWAYEVHASMAGDEDSPPRITWTGEVGLDADTLLATPDDRKDAPVREEAEELIREVLAKGPILYSEIVSVAKKCGISETTLKRARMGMKPGVKTRRVRDDKGRVSDSEWRLEA